MRTFDHSLPKAGAWRPRIRKERRLSKDELPAGDANHVNFSAVVEALPTVTSTLLSGLSSLPASVFSGLSGLFSGAFERDSPITGDTGRNDGSTSNKFSSSFLSSVASGLVSLAKSPLGFVLFVLLLPGVVAGIGTRAGSKGSASTTGVRFDVGEPSTSSSFLPDFAPPPTTVPASSRSYKRARESTTGPEQDNSSFDDAAPAGDYQSWVGAHLSDEEDEDDGDAELEDGEESTAEGKEADSDSEASEEGDDTLDLLAGLLAEDDEVYYPSADEIAEFPELSDEEGVAPQEEPVKKKRRTSKSASPSTSSSNAPPLPPLPRSSDLWQALIISLEHTSMPSSWRSAAVEHCAYLQRSMPTSALPTEQDIATQEAAETQLKKELQEIVQEHKLPAKTTDRFRKATGWVESCLGIFLYYPPDSNHGQEVLVRGPFTANAFLDAGMSSLRKFIIDLISMTLAIPYGSSASALHADETLGDARANISNLFLYAFWQAVESRLGTHGVEIVFRSQAKVAFCTKADSMGWEYCESRASVACPGYANSHRAFKSGYVTYVYRQYYKSTEAGLSFGKLVIFHPHPCRVATRAGAGVEMTEDDLYEGTGTDILVDFAIQNTQGSPANRDNDTSLFAWRGIPRPARRTQVTFWDVNNFRSREKTKGTNMTRAEIGEDIIGYIEARTQIDYTSDVSILAQACSDSVRRGAQTLGPAGRRAKALKAIRTLGPAGCRARTRKANETLGPEGRRERSLKTNRTMGPAGRRARAIKGNQTLGVAGRKERSRNSHATLGPEGRHAAGKLRESRISPERRSKIRRKATRGRSRKAKIALIPEDNVYAKAFYAECWRRSTELRLAAAAGKRWSSYSTIARTYMLELRRQVYTDKGGAPCKQLTLAQFDAIAATPWPTELSWNGIDCTVHECETLGARLLRGDFGDGPLVDVDSDGELSTHEDWLPAPPPALQPSLPSSASVRAEAINTIHPALASSSTTTSGVSVQSSKPPTSTVAFHAPSSATAYDRNGLQLGPSMPEEPQSATPTSAQSWAASSGNGHNGLVHTPLAQLRAIRKVSEPRLSTGMSQTSLSAASTPLQFGRSIKDMLASGSSAKPRLSAGLSRS